MVVKIKSIELTNFQSHRHLLVKFSPKITTIKGSTDKGKSAIIRALGWCCLNNFSGDEFIKEGEKKASAAIVAVEGKSSTLIERKRSAGGGVNTYTIDGEELKAFGLGVPDGIKEHLRLSPINFQSQHDPPFWFTETAGEVSRQLNSIIDLSVIDSSLGHVHSLVRANHEKLKICKERMEGVDKELEELIPQLERVKDFQNLQQLKDEADEHQKNLNRLDDLVETIRSNKSKRLKKKSEKIDQVFRAAKLARRLSVQTSQLQELVEGFEKAQKKAIAPPDFSEVENRHKDWRGRLDNISILTERIEQINHANNRLQEARIKLKTAEDELHEQTQGSNCPLCGNPIE